MSGLGRTLRQYGLRPAQVPGDELANEARTVALADEPAELLPVRVGNANDAVRGVGVLRSANHALRVSAAYATCLATRLTMHMHDGKVLHMHIAPLAGITTCRHTDYLMTCQQFDDLLKRSQQRCEICGRHGSRTSHRQLYIDHDKWRGMWAVRGLLCGRCNSMLEHEKHFTPEVAQYLDASWWRSMLSALDVAEEPGEPPLGSVVYAGQCCHWKRDRKGWFCTCGRHRHRSSWQRKTWHQVVRAFGPHRIRIPKEQA